MSASDSTSAVPSSSANSESQHFASEDGYGMFMSGHHVTRAGCHVAAPCVFHGRYLVSNTAFAAPVSFDHHETRFIGCNFQAGLPVGPGAIGTFQNCLISGVHDVDAACTLAPHSLGNLVREA